jgi:RNA 2',3'-cyclic 3'-phosphodiesterase
MTQPATEATRHIRSFIAVGLPEPARAAIARVIDQLRGVGDVRWVTPEQLHVTLKFLGDATPAQLAETATGLREKANAFSRFVVELGWLEAFPNLARPRVVWLGAAGGASELTALAAAVEACCVSSGFPHEDRSFRAHLTLGRIRSPRDLTALAGRLRSLPPVPLPPVPVAEILLMESDLQPTGAVYRVRERIALAGQESSARDDT